MIKLWSEIHGDGDGHEYLIPCMLVERFYKWLEEGQDLGVYDKDDYNEFEFDEYRIEGGLKIYAYDKDGEIFNWLSDDDNA